MANGIDLVRSWHFIREGRPSRDVMAVLLDGERVLACYQTVRDQAVFTDLRLIVRDAQGITGKKVEVFSVPWESVQMWSSENAGQVIDIDSEIELWTLVGHLKINLARGVDVRAVERIIASRVFG